jgi:hypothetical protein
MAIAASDILLRLSGGSGNTDPNASLGGVMSTSTVITDNTANNLFDQKSGAESTAGRTEYRGFYVLNNHGSLTWQSAKIWLDSETSHGTVDMEIALAGEGLNATMETIANETTAPSGESFVDAATEGAALSLGNIPSGQRYGVWLKLVVPAATAAVTDYTVVIKVKGDTAA